MSDFSSSTLRVNLSAIVANWEYLREQHAGEECGAVVKANAYGLGVAPVSRALADAGCNTFFVATLDEGIELREVLPNRRVVVFHGVQENEEKAFLEHQLIPCLNSPKQIERWQTVAKDNANATSILHVDTGMARLGLTDTEWRAFAEEHDAAESIRAAALMSHFACASEPKHKANTQQIKSMQEVSKHFPTLPVSLCNSGGIMNHVILSKAKDHKQQHTDSSAPPQNGSQTLCQLARPGCALYGINPLHGDPHPDLKNVAELTAPILQIRTLENKQRIGYGHTRLMDKSSKMATVALGYADGVLRHLSNLSAGYMGEYQVPQVGRVTMDMMCFDVSCVPDELCHEGARITFIGEQQPVDVVATHAKTIGYEVFTRLGSRIRREYV